MHLTNQQNRAGRKIGPVIIVAVVISVLVTAVDGVWAQPTQGLSQQAHGVRVKVSSRTPDQVLAFYTARNLPMAAVNRLVAACLITVTIRNRSQKVVWIEPHRWRFVLDDGELVERLDRHYWDDVWQQLKVPLGSRATFGWTQLPESRDLQHGEPVGGNVVLKRTNKTFAVEARLATGKDKKGAEIVLRIPNVKCAVDKASP
ncbi:MAG TPA: hypothetical protein ENI80_09875 [Acidiferrobacteraceae bacterium]|nr:hypothetical protein [Acidiferrobacteraceae bacterium]